jgi:hypothetical protein
MAISVGIRTKILPILSLSKAETNPKIAEEETDKRNV